MNSLEELPSSECLDQIRGGVAGLFCDTEEVLIQFDPIKLKVLQLKRTARQVVPNILKSISTSDSLACGLEHALNL